MYVKFLRVAEWFSHYVYVIANSTGCNPRYTRQYKQEWDEWRSKRQLAEMGVML